MGCGIWCLPNGKGRQRRGVTDALPILPGASSATNPIHCTLATEIFRDRNVVRLHDKTDHGGEVISASSGTIVFGIEAALADDLTWCPKCKGKFPLTPDGEGAKHQQRPYAYDGDLTACGARVLASIE